MTKSSYNLFISGVFRNAETCAAVLFNRAVSAVFVVALVQAPMCAQTDDLAKKFQAMEQRIQALESELAAVKAALGTLPAPAAPQPVQATQAPAPLQPGAGSGGTQLSDATARLMNPAISMIGNELSAAG